MGILLRKLLIPGFVPFFKRNKGIGIIWMIGAFYGYFYFIIPGLIIHFIYIYKYCWKEVKLLIKGNNNAEHLASQVEQIAQKQSEKIKKVQALGEQSIFEDAVELVNNQKFDKAVAILEKIPMNSEFYTEAQVRITEYRIIYQQRELEKALELAANNNFANAISILKKIPANSELYKEAQAKITEYQNKIEKEKKRKLAEAQQKLAEAQQQVLAKATEAQAKITEYQNNIANEIKRQLSEAQQQELAKALELAANNNFENAISILNKIPANSEFYKEAQAKITEYQNKIEKEKKRKLAEAQQQELERAIKLAANNNFEEAITTLEKIPTNSALYREAQAKVTDYRRKYQQQQLENAIQLADNRNFDKAITTLETIPASSELYKESQVRITEYRKRYQSQELAKAIELADNKNFDKAIATLERIYESSELYTEAQFKITEYKHKIENEKKRKLLETQQHDLNTAINLAKINKFEEAIINLAKIPVSSELYRQAQAKIAEYEQKIKEERKKRQAEAGGRAIEVVEIFEQNGLSLEKSLFESIDGRMIVVVMDLSNTSKKSGNFTFSQFQLIDSNQNTYNELVDMTYTLWRQEKGFGSRNDDYFPGEIRQDAAVFRVSPIAKDFTLKWNGKTIKLWL